MTRFYLYFTIFAAAGIPSVATETTDKDWWKHTIIYQVYPRSFQDSDGDGVGDIQGIISRLDHFKYLEVDAVWLSPIYESPMADFGYDVSNRTNIDPIFGTLDDFDQMVKAMHDKGLKLIMDFIPNHTSDKHPWFEKSRQGGADNQFSDYYTWDAGTIDKDGVRQPPNNWLSIFGGSAWTWDETRQQYYLHQFLAEQPDLNYRNPDVRQEIKDELNFWLARGVDGFRVDAIQTLGEAEDLSLNEPLSGLDVPEDQFDYLDHRYTHNHPLIHTMAREWRDVFDEHEEKTGHHIFVVMELYDKTMVHIKKYYHTGADMPFNFGFIAADKDCMAKCFLRIIRSWMNMMPQQGWPNFVLGNHDNMRMTSRKGSVYADALNVMLLTLPGTPTTYYGEEIALKQIQVSYEDTQDPWGKYFGPERYHLFSRDPERAPMQWSDDVSAGFSSSQKTWLPVNAEYKTQNVQKQKDDPKSSLNIYKRVAKLRRQSAFRNDDVIIHVVNDHILSYIRASDTASYLVALNLGVHSSKVDLSCEVDGTNYKKGMVMVVAGKRLHEAINVGGKMDLRSVRLQSGDALVLQLVAGYDEL